MASRASRSAFALASIAGLALAAETQAQIVATVTSCSGTVTRVEASTGAHRSLLVIPDSHRVGNGALASGDEVRTGAGSDATILFPDGSLLQLAASTHLAISETETANRRRPEMKSTRRQIRLVSGRVACSIRENESAMTALRCAAGTVGARGDARFTAALEGDRLLLDVDNGQVVALDATGQLGIPMRDRQRVRIQREGSDAATVTVEADAGRSIPATLGPARLRLKAGSAVRVAGHTESTVRVSALAGAVDWTPNAEAAAQAMPLDKSFVVERDREPVAPAPPAEPPPTEVATPARLSSAEASALSLPAIPWIGDTVESSPIK